MTHVIGIIPSGTSAQVQRFQCVGIFPFLIIQSGFCQIDIKIAGDGKSLVEPLKCFFHKNTVVGGEICTDDIYLKIIIQPERYE